MKNIPILILHGWNLSAERFLPLSKELEKRGYKVLCPDLPGFGKSEVPRKPLYLSDYVKFVENYIEKNKLKEVILIGHSFGGRISIKLAALNPIYLRTLILTGAPGLIPVPKVKIRFFLILAKLGKLIFSLPVLISARGLFRRFLYKIANASDYYNTNDNMLEAFQNIVNESLTPYLSQINTPTLLIWGSEDEMVPVYIAEKMIKIIKNSKLVIIPQTRHGVLWTHPKEFANEVEKFLKELI